MTQLIKSCFGAELPTEKSCFGAELPTEKSCFGANSGYKKSCFGAKSSRKIWLIQYKSVTLPQKSRI